MNAKNNSRKHASRGMRRGRLALALALALLAPAAWAGVVPSCTNCLPEVGTVVSGAATSNLDLGGVMRPGPTTEDTMTITQTTSSAIINWNTLNVAGGFTLNFVQPDANSVTLNRVIGVPGIGITPSIIHGNINANGNVFIINPTGILFGKSSAVNVGGLVASTLAISDSDFLTGAGMADPHYIFTPDTSGAIGPVVNQGQLTTAVGGTIALLAARIENQPDAVISAPGGSVTFGAAQGVNLDFYNDGLTTVTLTGTGFKDGFGCAEGIITSSCAGGIVNNGDITAAGGHVEMRTETEFAATNGTLFTETVMGGRIWIGGTIRANSDSTYTNPGSIILDAGHGNVDIGGLPGTWPPAKGLVSANAFGAGQDAGTIEIRGYQLFTHLCVGLLGVCNANDSLGWIDATANGAGGNGGQITIDVMDRFYNAGLIQAASFGGNGGTINIVSGNRVENYNWILAESGAGTGGTITITAPSILLQRGQMPWLGGPGILYSQAVLSAYGATNGGSVNLFGGLSALDSGGVTPGDPEYVPYINVRGMNGNGGSVMVSNYDSVYIHPVWFINANGTANGGTVSIVTQNLYAQGDITANGDLDGGSITLTAYSYLSLTGHLDANGGADGGDVNLSAYYLLDVGGSATINANGVANGGSIDLYSSNGMRVYGSLSANGGLDGGSIDLNSDSLTVYGGGILTANGDDGGGTIHMAANYLTVSGSVIAYGDVDGGSIDLDAVYSIVIDGSLAANGGVNGGTVDIYAGYAYSSYATVSITGVLQANGGLNATDQIGNGGTINVYGQTIDVGATGLIEANGGIGFYQDPDDPGLDRWSYGGTVFLSADDVTLSGTFNLWASGFWGDLYTAGFNRILIDENASITSSHWYIDGTEAWITTTAGAPTHTNGAVIVDQALATAMENGTAIVVRTNSALGGGSGTGDVNFVDFTSILPNALPGSYIGNLQVQAENAINGTDFSIIGPSFLSLTAGGAITLSDFTLDIGGTVNMQGGGISLQGGIIDTANDFTLDAYGSLIGIAISGSSQIHAAGDIALSAGNSTYGIQISGSDVESYGGTITLDADGAFGGILIDASKVYSHGGYLALHASSNDNGGITITGGSIVDAGAGAVLLDTANGDNGISIDGSAVHAGTGDLTMYAYATAGIHLFNGATVDTDGGNIRMYADDSRYGFVVDAATVASYGGDIVMSSSGYNTGGIWLQNGAAIDSGDGAIRLAVVGGNVGIRVNDASSIHADGGDITLDAYYNDGGIQVNYGSTVYSRDGAVRLLAPYGDGGIVIFGSMIHAGSAGITLDANYTNGIRVEYGSTVESTGGDILLLADRSSYGIYIDASTIQSSGADITMHSGSGVGGGIVVQNAAMIDSGGGAILLGVDGGEFGIYVGGSTITSATGDITLDATGNLEGIQIRYDASIASTSGDITLTALGSGGGIAVYESQISSGTGGISLEGESAYLYGVVVTDSDILSAGGNIGISGSSTQALGYGVLIQDNSTISSGGGDIDLTGANANGAGLWIDDSSVTSAGGSIAMQGTGGSVGGVDLYYSSVDSGVGDIVINGSIDGYGWGVFVYGTRLTSTDGDIAITGHADTGYGIELRSGDTQAARITSGSGNINLVGDGSLAGVLLNDASAIASTSGDIGIDGRATTGAGVNLTGTASVDAGSGTVVLRAANDGSSDSIIIDGAVSSTTGVNLRPLDVTDTLYLGGGNGFVLDNVELSHITTPWLVLGSNLQQGAIRVQSDIAYAGNLSLQNQGGTAGIHLSGMLDVSGYTLGLFAGGSIGQSGAGSIHAKSLIAIASGDVLLASAQNDVTGNTLAGSAGGQFRYLDADELAIGNVTGYGFNAGVGGGLASVGASGINAYGNVLVRTLSGNLTMNANVNGVDVDLVTAGVFLNPASATISASGSWRVWASTWVGEDRGGLAGSGTLPNLYNCTYGGPCGVTVGSGNHFIYTQQPTLTVMIADFSREYGDANPTFTFDADGLILGDALANVLYGSVGSSATSGSNVGQYLINGSFTSPAGYAIYFLPGTLTITPAMLVFTADPLIWYMGIPFPSFTGTASGFKNGDTMGSVFGSNPVWFTYATPMSMPGFYAIYGGASSATNYTFSQASSNSTALQLLPLSQTSDLPTEFFSDPRETELYTTNFDQVQMCPVADVVNDQALAGGDSLGNEWSKVRRRLNLLNCFNNERNAGCSSF